MNPMAITADLGNEDFTTYAELKEMVCGIRETVDLPIAAIYISPWQQKLLRLEAVEKRGLNNTQARQLDFKSVASMRIIVWDGYGMPPCPDCGKQHC
jgi:hypothetical protein